MIINTFKPQGDGAGIPRHLCQTKTSKNCKSSESATLCKTMMSWHKSHIKPYETVRNGVDTNLFEPRRHPELLAFLLAVIVIVSSCPRHGFPRNGWQWTSMDKAWQSDVKRWEWTCKMCRQKQSNADRMWFTTENRLRTACFGALISRSCSRRSLYGGESLLLLKHLS